MTGRRLAAAVLAVVVALTIGTAPPAGAVLRRTTTTHRTTTTLVPGPPALPKSWLLVDVDTGRVLDEQDPHTLRRPASTIKLLTALTARRLLKPEARVPISTLAASMPAVKIGLVAGKSWPLDQILDATLVVSANDAAVALAEAAGGGSLDTFATEMQRTANTLGLVDSPLLQDPTGLDNTFAHAGGDWISTWDLALVGQAAIGDNVIARLAASPIVQFDDPDGHAHRLINHNKLLQKYSGATGLKTGYTTPAGNTLVATATRDGRTMLVVVLDAANPYGAAASLLDKGFATDAAYEIGVRLSPRLPHVPLTPVTVPVTVPVAKESTSGHGTIDVWSILELIGGIAVFAGVMVRGRRRTRGPS